ncbi:uncharacterized protein LOC127084014 [Lathyrus oleraceus]|uniref:uncharacterized protein LOC127084014 n=1 Tax=Pisum sativum TaxID=3888 RepID=UPI0021D1E3CF|nr:uncharacterized protein LOC127084014 [Pisum sativum]
MGPEFFSLFHLERNRFLYLIITITFALIFVFQYFDLPYGNILVPSKFHAADLPPSAPEIYNNITLLNQTYPQHPFQKVSETKLYEKNNTISRTDIGVNLTRDVNNTYVNFHSPSVNAERFKPLQDDVNVISSNQSSITDTVLPKENKSSLVKVPDTISISEMDKLLLQNYASYRSTRPRWSSAVDQELLQARFEIENAPVVTDLGNLYAPLFRNVSMFKRYHFIILEVS